jgi:hypothetical protein
MKLILALLLAIAATSASATDITVINEGSPQSPTTVFGLALKNAIGPDTKWEQATSCQDAQSKFKKIKNSVVIYNTTNDFADRMKASNCQTEPITVKNAVIITTTYMKICRAVGNTHKISDKGVTLGLASMVATAKHQANWNAHGANLKFVPYGGSAGVARAAASGEIDYGWIGSAMATKMEQDGKLECLYSTDPASPKFLGNSFALDIPDFQIVTVAYTNSTDSAVMKQLKIAASSEEFQKWLANGETVGFTDIKRSDVDSVNGYVTLMMNRWGDK